MGGRVVVTGSRRGNALAWRMAATLLRFFGLTPRLSRPGDLVEGPFEGLLLLGGVDIDPGLYAKAGHEAVKRIEPERDAHELAWLRRAKEEGVPVLGICRGMQMINLFFGGTLVPHLYDLPLRHPHPKTPLPLKTVKILPDTLLRDVLKTDRIRVNALHHQSVARLGDGLRVCALDANGLVQAIERRRGFWLGVQWHPEYLPYMWHTRAIFGAFASRVGGI